MKLADAVFDFFSGKGVSQCFAVTGGAAAHLFDSVAKYDYQITHMHHEQACAMAADGYSRIAKKPAIVLVTNGPGVSNAITGVLGAFQDSVPMIVLSGQVSTHQMLSQSGNAKRQFGVQEVETGPLVSSIVKYFATVMEAHELPEILNRAWHEATNGRPGPVWIEVPLNVQAQEIPEFEATVQHVVSNEAKYDEFLKCINESSRPLIVIGGGIHSSNSEQLVRNFAEASGIPVVSTWGANDIFRYDEDLYIGNFGILGNRIPNFAIQKADLLIILGTRLSIPNIGYQTELFSPHSQKIMVDIDSTEMNKKSIRIDLKIESDLRIWLSNLPIEKLHVDSRSEKWKRVLNELEKEFGIENENLITEKGKIDSYKVIDELSRLIPQNSILATDMGTSFTCTMQAFKNVNNVRLFTSSGTSSMGFGLPGAIGAYFADPTKPIYLIAGDGGFQMNIQELQTVVHHKIPLKIIVLNSNGYLAISIMQNNLFNGRLVGSDPNSGVDAPAFTNVANAYGIRSQKISSIDELQLAIIRGKLNNNPELFEIDIPANQFMRPRSQSLRRDDGTFYSHGIEIMWPYLENHDLDHIESKLS